MKKSVNKFRSNIMELLRKERGININDISQDKLINSYSVNEAYKKLLAFGNYNDFNIEIKKEFIDNLYR